MTDKTEEQLYPWSSDWKVDRGWNEPGWWIGGSDTGFSVEMIDSADLALLEIAPQMAEAILNYREWRDQADDGEGYRAVDRALIDLAEKLRKIVKAHA